MASATERRPWKDKKAEARAWEILEALKAAAAKVYVEKVPKPTAKDHQWFCNGCVLVTPHVSRAREHAQETMRETPFAHYLYERSKPDGKPKRRMVVVAGAVVVQARG